MSRECCLTAARVRVRQGRCRRLGTRLHRLTPEEQHRAHAAWNRARTIIHWRRRERAASRCGLARLVEHSATQLEGQSGDGVCHCSHLVDVARAHRAPSRSLPARMLHCDTDCN
jgi:hypothetical protein